MDIYDVISVEEVNDWLSLNLELGDDQEIKAVQRLIKTAVAWVEQYTSYRLYPREEVIANSKCDQSIAYYPIASISVKYQNGDTAEFKKYLLPTKLRITCPWNSVITLTTGYTDPADIPPPLVEACYKLITYLYENRDMYQNTLPTDVQLLINQYRRALI